MATPLEKLEKKLLPKTKTPARLKLEDFNVFIYGPPKVGKTTLASQFDSPVFAATEAGLNAIEAYQVSIPDWKTFLEFCAEIASGEHTFKTVVVDTIDNLFDACSEHVCKKAGVQHESDLDWGKGWAMVRDEFSRALTKLSLLPYGLVMISHAKDVEMKTRTGNLTKTVPTMSEQARRVILPMADFILYCSMELTKDGPRRVIRTRPSENWDAGTRFKEFPAEIEMSFSAFKKAFEEGIKSGRKA